MKTININSSDIKATAVSLGCMRIDSLDEKELDTLINTALDEGINFFDHADIYGGNGLCEELFGKAYKGKREDIILQTKCGIVQTGKDYNYFDFSKEHIIESVEKSLKRLNTDYIDIYLLHRPDALVEPTEVAEAFSKLHKDGKVREFGVSNHNPSQIELLNKSLTKKIVANQLQLSIDSSGLIDQGLYVNMKDELGVDRDGGILNYCRLNNILVQAWSPFQYGFFEGVFLDNPKFQKLNDELKVIGEKYNVSKTTIATAWILRHPANIQVIAGTTKPSRLKEIAKATEITLTREEWYRIYQSSGKTLP